MLAAVVLDALAAPADPDLDSAVGPGAAQRVRRVVRDGVRRWAEALAPGRAFEATSAASAVAALAGHDGPVVLVAPDVPTLGPAHARAVLDDLDAGVALAVGSAHDARPYLVVLGSADPALIECAGDGWEALMNAAAERDLSVAMLRPERRLVGAADVRALALDPLAPAAVVEQLGDLRPGRTRAQ